MTDPDEEIIRFVSEHSLEKIGVRNVREIWFFGSRANGSHRDNSDWDFFVVVNDDGPEGHGIMEPAQVTLLNELREAALGAGVTTNLLDIDVLTTYASKFDDAAASAPEERCGKAKLGRKVWP